MNDQQKAVMNGVMQGVIAAAPTAAAAAIGVAAVADPRVATAMEAAQLSMQLINTASKLNSIGGMTDKELLAMWAQRGAAMIAAHNQLFDDTLQSQPTADQTTVQPVVQPAPQPQPSTK